MRRGLKIVLFTVAGIGRLFIVFVAFVLFEIFRPQPEHHVSKEAQLSNGGILLVHGLEYNGPHGVPYFWDASYQTASGATKETVGIWGGGSVDGDVVGCPIGDLVVVNPLLSRDFFVRTAAGRLRPNALIAPTPELSATRKLSSDLVGYVLVSRVTGHWDQVSTNRGRYGCLSL